MLVCWSRPSCASAGVFGTDDRRRTREGPAVEQIQLLELGAVGERVQRTWGGGGAVRFRGQCVSATSAGGLGGQRFKLAISRRGARARTSNIIRPPQVEFDESGAFGEWFKRPWGEQWAKGPEVSVNLHWWSRRFAVQVKNGEAERAYD